MSLHDNWAVKFLANQDGAAEDKVPIDKLLALKVGPLKKKDETLISSKSYIHSQVALGSKAEKNIEKGANCH